MARNLLVVQCGGPTAVINASLAAVIAAAQRDAGVARVFGCRRGWAGLAQGDWVDLTALTPAHLSTLRLQPGAALGGGRVPLDDAALSDAVAHLRCRDVGVVCAIGGNGTMAAAQKLETVAHAAGLPLCVVGIPKTIDNDLVGTDVAPGYGSAARFVAQSTRDMALDLESMANFDDVTVVEWMGRHVGWLTAAAALARRDPDDAPHLILLPETPADEADVLAAIAAVHARRGMCMVAVSEGVRDTAGVYWAEKGRAVERDASGQKLLSLAAGVAPYLARRVQQELGLRCRQVRADTMQRSSRALASAADRTLAEQAGAAAVHAACASASGVMLGLQRDGDWWMPTPVPFADVVGRERAMPPAFLDPAHFDVSAAFVAYAGPLVRPIANDDLQLARPDDAVAAASFVQSDTTAHSVPAPPPPAPAPGAPVFIGIDLAWSARNPSGGAVIVGDRLVEATGELGDDDAILAFVARHLRPNVPLVIGVDAPLRVPNAEGARPCDRALTHEWARFEAGALPANRRLLARDGSVRGERLVAALAARFAVVETAPIPRQAAGRFVCEIYPHPALVSLFNLERTLKYKGRKGRGYPERWAALDTYRRLLTTLAAQDPPVRDGLDDLLTPDLTTLRGKAFKRVEDKLDAVTCAYVAAYLWRHGPARTRVYGDVAGGHILVPLTPRMVQRLRG